MSLHEEVLGRAQPAVLSLVGPALEAEGFYLGGGTALALHLGHRRSVDLDWFANHAIDDVLQLGSRLQGRGVPLAVERADSGTLHGRVRSVHISLLEYPFPLIGQLVYWPERGCHLASLDDLAAMKLSAIAQRGAKRDFVDIYSLATAYRPLHELLETYRRKYGILGIAHVLYGLTYFDLADRDRTPPMLWDVDWRAVKRAIRQWVEQLAR